MHCLYAGGVVVQDHDLLVIRLDLFLQKAVNIGLVFCLKEVRISVLTAISLSSF